MIKLGSLVRKNRAGIARVVIAGTTALTIAGTLSCLSDRMTVTGVDASACNVQLPSAAFGSAIVVIRNFTFSPSQVHVAAGQNVTWVNCDAPGSDSHTSTADAGKWSSPVLSSGELFTTEYANSGTFSYHCEIHPGMTGSVVVE